jgi:hypothetical protein
MLMNVDRRCIRCGKPEQDDDTKGRFELELALSEDDPERRTAACLENFANLTHLYDIDGGAACWNCLTLAERHGHESQCERCGAQYHDDGRDSDAGWIIGYASLRYLCPDCITLDEDEADTERHLAMVEAGKRHCSAQGKEYPADLAFLGDRERARLDRRRAERAGFDRLLGSPGGES